MTIIPVMLVYCDGGGREQDGCPLEGKQGLPDHEARTIAEAWKIAKSKGWKRRGTMHYCPYCASTLKPSNTGIQRPV